MLSFVPRTVVSLTHGRDVAATLRSVRALELSTDLDLDIIVLHQGDHGNEHAALVNGLKGRGSVLQVDAAATAADLANVAVDRAVEVGSRFVWFLSPSITIETWTLGRLIRYANTVPDCAVVGPRIMQPGEPEPLIIWSDGGVASPSGRVTRQSAGRSRHKLAKARPVDMDAVERAGALYRTVALEAVGPFDASDDVDGHDLGWCHRARKAGWRTVVQQRARLTLESSDV
jgi:GT2 family glycosyltransferase